MVGTKSRVQFLFALLVFAISVYSSGAALAAGQEIQSLYDQLDQNSDRSKNFLSDSERKNLLTLVSTNPVAALSAESHYDPEGDIGFCFGRAMTAHLLARKLGLKENAIGKLFVIGDLRSGADPEWRFHVTTLVLGEDNQWYAIDPIMTAPLGPGTPLLPETWMATVQSVWDKNKKAHFYHVDRNTIMPNMTVMPASSEVENGDRIIELKFDPTTKTGFEPEPFANQQAFRVSPAAQERYFLHANGDTQDNRFNFIRLEMTVLANGTSRPRLFDFHNYFSDLMADLKNPLRPQ